MRGEKRDTRLCVVLCSSALTEVMLQQLTCGGAAVNTWTSPAATSSSSGPDQRHGSACVIVTVSVQVLSDDPCEAEHAVPPRDASLPPHCSRTRRTPSSGFDSDLDSLFLWAGQKVWREMCDFCFVWAASGSLLTLGPAAEQWSAHRIITHFKDCRALDDLLALLSNLCEHMKLFPDVFSRWTFDSGLFQIWTQKKNVKMLFELWLKHQFLLWNISSQTREHGSFLLLSFLQSHGLCNVAL